MEGILHTFGIDGRLIIVQIINFALLAVALWYFLYTPVLKLLKDRHEKIEKGVADAEAAEATLSQADDEKKTILTTAHKEAEDINSRAKAHADERSNEIVTDAKNRASTILSDAEKKTDELKEQKLKESEADVAKLAVLAAERVIREKQS